MDTSKFFQGRHKSGFFFQKCPAADDLGANEGPWRRGVAQVSEELLLHAQG
jgi:hypothetical protein